MATITDEEKKSIAEDVKKQLIASAKSVQDFEKITELPESGSVTLPVVQPDGSAKTFDAGNWLKDREDAYKATQSATADAKTATSAANEAAESANNSAEEANSAAEAAKKRTEELNATDVSQLDTRVTTLESSTNPLTEMIEVWDVIDEKDVIARYTDKVLDTDTLEWKESTIKSPTWVIRLNGAIKLQHSHQRNHYWKLLLCEDLDSNLLPTKAPKVIGDNGTYDCKDYQYLIINGLTNDDKGSTLYAYYSLGEYPDCIFLIRQVERWKYEASASKDNGATLMALAKYSIDGKTDFFVNPLMRYPATSRNDIKGVSATRARNIYLNCEGKLSLNVKMCPRLESVYCISPKNVFLYYCRSLKEANIVDTSAVTSMSGMFRGCSSLQSLDVSKFTFRNSLQQVFYRCGSLKELQLGVKDFSQATSYAWIFDGCYALSLVTGTISGIGISISLANCPLTRESALVFLNGLADLTGKTAQTISFHANTKKLLTDDDIAIATKKNWNLA